MKLSKLSYALVLVVSATPCLATPYIAPASKVNLFLDSQSGALTPSDYLNPTSNTRLVKESAKTKIVSTITSTTGKSIIYGDAYGRSVKCGGANYCATTSETNYSYAGQCVTFAKAMTKVVGTSSWYRGDSLTFAIGALAKGTMIAYFDGKDVYPGNSTNGHVAIYLATVRDTKNSITGIWVVDQNWSNDMIMAKRLMPWSGTGKAGAKNYNVVSDVPISGEAPL